MDLITSSLNNYYRARIDLLTSGNQDILFKINIHFQNFLLFIHRKKDVIVNQIYGNNKKPLKLETSNNGITFTFIVNIDKTSVFNIEVKTSKADKRDYDKNFLVARLKKKEGYVYFLKSDLGYKIGRSSRLMNRLKLFSLKIPFKFSIRCPYIKNND